MAWKEQDYRDQSLCSPVSTPSLFSSSESRLLTSPVFLHTEHIRPAISSHPLSPIKPSNLLVKFPSPTSSRGTLRIQQPHHITLWPIIHLSTSSPISPCPRHLLQRNHHPLLYRLRHPIPLIPKPSPRRILGILQPILRFR